MKEVLEDLESILNQKIVQDFKISSTVRSELGKVSEKKVESTSLVAEDDVIYGRDEDKEMIISWLTSDSDNQYLPSVLSIVGMGGMGKTTLAQHVFVRNTSVSLSPTLIRNKKVEHYIRFWVESDVSILCG